MLSEKKSVFKRVLITIIAIIFLFSAVSFVATKIVYDSIFSRVDEPIILYDQYDGMLEKREEYKFSSGENMLSGYLYRAEKETDKNALIVLSCGFKASADSYLPQIESLKSFGWSVFVYDNTGSFSSEGESTVGFPQALLDLEAALKYIEEMKRFDYNDIVLLGHSRGGYASISALKYDYDISAVVSVSGINSAMEGVIGTSANALGNLAYSNYGFLWLYQASLFGADTLNTEADEVLSDSTTPTLIIHGEKDDMVPIDKYSVYSYKNKIENKNAEYLLSSKGHTDLLFSSDGGADSELMKNINSFLEENIN